MTDFIRRCRIVSVAFALGLPLVVCGAVALKAAIHPAHAAQPRQQAHARISVPPAGPATLVAADGFAALTDLGGGVYELELEPGLTFGPTLSLSCTATHPGASCAADVPDDGVWRTVIVYRWRWGVAEKGDVWLSASL